MGNEGKIPLAGKTSDGRAGRLHEHDEFTGPGLVKHRPDPLIEHVEIKVVAAALYEASRLSESQLLEIARRMGANERAAVLRAYVGNRANRRHRPGRFP